MKLSQNFFYTLREDVKNEDCKSSNLLVKSGMIKRISSGIYMYMPLGLKTIRNIEKIVRDEMNKQGALELLMPSLLPSEAYEKSGRKENFGKSMFNLKDRNNRDYVLGPTHEELFVNAASNMIKSYKDMPFFAAECFVCGLKSLPLQVCMHMVMPVRLEGRKSLLCRGKRKASRLID